MVFHPGRVAIWALQRRNASVTPPQPGLPFAKRGDLKSPVASHRNSNFGPKVAFDRLHDPARGGHGLVRIASWSCVEFHVSLFVCTNHAPKTNRDAVSGVGVVVFPSLLHTSGTDRRARLAYTPKCFTRLPYAHGQLSASNALPRNAGSTGQLVERNSLGI